MWRKLLKEDHHNLDYSPSIIGIGSNRVKSMIWSFKLLRFVYPCQLVIEFEGCDMFPWRLCAPLPPLVPLPALPTQMNRHQSTSFQLTDWLHLAHGFPWEISEPPHGLFIYFSRSCCAWMSLLFVCGGGGGGVVTFERKQICNFVLFCWTLTNCRIPHLIVLVVMECCWFVQKLGKWGLECVVWYVIVSTLIVGRTYSSGTCGSNNWVGYPARFLLCINELCRVSIVIRLQAGQLRIHYSVPGRGS